MAAYVGKKELAHAAASVLRITGGALVAWTFVQREWLQAAAILIVTVIIVAYLQATQ